MIEITDLGVRKSLDNIFSAILVGGINQKTEGDLYDKKIGVVKFALNYFRSLFQQPVFTDEYALLYSTIDTLGTTAFIPSQLQVIIEKNFDSILENPNMDMSKYSMSSNNVTLSRDEKLQVFTEDILEKFDELSHNYVTQDEFQVACKVYIMFFKEAFMNDTVNNMSLIMNMGFDYKKPNKRVMKLKGIEDAQMYYRDRQIILDSLSMKNAGKHIRLDADTFKESLEKSNKEDSQAILDYGLDEIDSVKRPLRRSHMLNIIGAPKGGKTTEATFLTNRALKKGLNVAVWILEGTVDEWEALIIALMVRESQTNPMTLNKSDILANHFKTAEEREAVMAAKAELYCSLNRGRISFVDEACYVEDFTEKINYHYENINTFDIFVMDSPVNIRSKHPMPKSEKIGDAFMKLKAHIKSDYNIAPACIVTSQLKQVAIDEIRNNPEADIAETAGGESAETIRTPDEIIGLFGSKAERKMGQTKIYHVESRHNPPFDNFYCGVLFGCGYYYSRPELNE